MTGSPVLPRTIASRHPCIDLIHPCIEGIHLCINLMHRFINRIHLGIDLMHRCRNPIHLRIGSINVCIESIHRCIEVMQLSNDLMHLCTGSIHRFIRALHRCDGRRVTRRERPVTRYRRTGRSMRNTNANAAAANSTPMITAPAHDRGNRGAGKLRNTTYHPV